MEKENLIENQDQSAENNEKKEGEQPIEKFHENYKKLNWFQKVARGAQKWITATYFGTIATPKQENKMYYNELVNPANKDKSVKEINEIVQQKYEKDYLEKSMQEMPDTYQKILEKIDELDKDISSKKQSEIKKIEKDLIKWQDNLKVI